MTISGLHRPAAETHILSVGMPVRDLVFHVKNPPALGHKAQAHRYEEIAGGNGLNAAIAMARLGARPKLCGPMGGDADGAAGYILHRLADERIDATTLVPMADVVTPISSIMIDPSGERTIITFRDPRLYEAKLPDTELLLDGCAAILVESRCAPFATELCAAAHRRGIPVVVDVDRKMAMGDPLMTAATHLVCSKEALLATTAAADTGEALRKLAAVTPAFVAATDGGNGMCWLDGSRLLALPAFAVTAVDTLGAGDVFHGAFTVAMAQGQSIAEAMRFSAGAAAIKCSRFGGAFGAPTSDELGAFLATRPSPSPREVD
ncbi:MAG TPA: PfkB family carbohydrate kinase [Xanthobacteraceae bacterium]|nr:PfkB family carbohydrate kinase [Xanthobacteraceae bacterium]